MTDAGVGVRWVTAFLDSPDGVHEESVGFWRAVTGYDVSPRRGSAGEFATLVPPDGDAHLRIQRVGSGLPGVHLDLHVAAAADHRRSSPTEPLGEGGRRDHLRVAAESAVGLGARVVATLDDVVVLCSPGGLPFCLVDGPESRRAAPAVWEGGHRSVVDQVCVDAPGESYDAEEAFWAALTGWPLQPRADQGIKCFTRPEGQPIRLILQRLDTPSGPVRAHLDLATDDREAEVARHTALGVEVVRRTPWWTTLRDPVGMEYCITDRDPATGLLRPR